MFRLPSGKKLCISTFYRVGTLGIENFTEFSNHFKLLASKNRIDKHILIGDFNINNVLWPDGHTNCYLHKSFVDFLINDLSHTQLISSPTHTAGNILDLMFTNIPDSIKSIRVLDHCESCLSDHFGISFNIDFSVRRKKRSIKKVYNYSKANWKELNYDLKRIDWNNLIGSIDTHSAWPAFKNILKFFCDKHIPKRNVKSEFQPPWYDSNCDRILRKKEKWRKKYKLSSNISDLNKFRQCRRDFKRVMNEKMRLSVEDSDDTALISKKFSRHVKSQNKSTRIPETIKYGDKFRTKPVDQANLFNEYFYAQFSEESSYDIDINFDPSENFNTLNFHALDVFLILKKMNASKAAGPDDIHGIVLKNCAASLAKPLSLLFNTSYNTGCIPAEWKLALVVPVHKKGEKGCVDNYRPISLTCLVMKVFERCIHKELLFKCGHFIDPRQHGFVNNRSCTTQMIPFIDNLALTLNIVSRSDIIYFDFAKAFDSVSHDLILRKLKNLYGIDGLMLRFIKSYLQDREQQVVVGGAVSDRLPVRSGVPQGSILGPLLFVLFINDIFSCISEGTKIALYADDTKIWRVINSYDDHFVLQSDINKLYAWSIDNKMTFHPSKCKVLSVTMQKNILDNLPFNIFWYQLNETLIECVNSHTDLGVILTPKLVFTEHCNSLLSKASSKLGLLIRTCHFTTNKLQKRAFYLAVIRSLFEHCSIIWYPHGSTQLLKFESIQRRAIKWINGEQFSSYSASIFFEKQKELNILPIRMKFIHNAITLFYKISNNLVTISLPDYIAKAHPEAMRYTRQNANTILRLDTTTYCCSILPSCNAFKYSFFYSTMLLWNALPATLRQIDKISSFKRELTTFLWTTANSWPD